MDIFAQQLINGLVLGAMYALVALGYTMVYGVLNLINFAHGDVLMIGAMVGWSLLQPVMMTAILTVVFSQFVRDPRDVHGHQLFVQGVWSLAHFFKNIAEP
jgi:branched-subunit amino acid ABC-type transport system permease component